MHLLPRKKRNSWHRIRQFFLVMPYSAHLLYVVQFVGKLKGSIKNWPVNPESYLLNYINFFGNEDIGLWQHEDFRPIHIVR